jgi:hypothetical protein
MNDCVSLPANPHAGPNEQRLRKLVTSSVADLDKAIQEWKAGADALAEVASSLSKQAEQLVEGYGRTGEIVAQSYTTLARNVMVREDEMKNVVLGLQDARKVVVESGPREFNGLPDVADPPDTDVMSLGIAARWERFDQQRAAREAKAAEALRTLDGEFQSAATKMGAPTPDDTRYTNSSEPAGSSGPLSTTRAGSVTSVDTGLITQPSGQHETGDDGLVIVTPTDPGTGHTSGDEHVTVPGTIGTPSSPPGSTTTGSLGGGAGAVAALGASAISGAGSVFASRGGAGVPLRGVPLGGVPSAGGRGMVPGASSAHPQGRGGKRGGKRDEGSDHVEYDDSRSWLDDEATSDPVID